MIFFSARFGNAGAGVFAFTSAGQKNISIAQHEARGSRGRI
jgi:hypothetical protein